MSGRVSGWLAFGCLITLGVAEYSVEGVQGGICEELDAVTRCGGEMVTGFGGFRVRKMDARTEGHAIRARDVPGNRPSACKPKL